MRRAAALLLPLCLLACKKDREGSTGTNHGDDGPIEPQPLAKAEIPHATVVRELRFLPDGRLLGLGRTVSVFELGKGGNELRELGWFGLAADREDPAPEVQRDMSKLEAWLRTHEGLDEIAVTPDGKHVIGGSDEALALWKLGAGAEAELVAEVRGAQQQLYGMELSPDGRWLLAMARPTRPLIERAGEDRFEYTPEGMLRLWKVDPGADTPLVAKAEILFEQRPGSAAFTGDGAYAIAVGSSQHLVVVRLDGDGGMQVAAEGRADDTFTEIVRIPGEGDRFATGGFDHSVRLWTLERGDPPKLTQTDTLRHHGGKIMALGAAPDGRWLIASSQDRTLSIWPLAAIEPGVTVQPVIVDPPDDLVYSVAVHPTRPLLATGGDVLQLWRVNRDLLAKGQGATRTQVARSLAAEAPRPMMAAAWSGDDTILTTSADGSVRRWTVGTELEAEVLRPGDSTAEPGSFYPGDVDRDVAAIGGPQGQLILVDSAAGSTGVHLPPDREPITAIAVRGGCVVAGTDNGMLVTWTRDGTALTAASRAASGAARIRVVEPSADGRLLLVTGRAADNAGVLYLYRFDPAACVPGDRTPISIPNTPMSSTGSSVSYPGGGGKAPVTAAFSPDGAWLLTADGENAGAILWRVDATTPSLEKVEFLTGHSDGASAVAFAPDGRRAVTAGSSGETFLWRLDPKTTPVADKLEDLPQPAQPAHFSYGAAFSPSGKRLAVPGGHYEDGRLWMFELGK